MFRRPVRRVRSGRFQLRLSSLDRQLLRTLPEQLKELLAEDDPSLRRLFPPAYADDAERDAEYQRLMHDDLADRLRGALDTMVATIDAPELDDEQLGAWLSGLNSIRLVLGTQLDVQEDVAGPDTPLNALYHYLTNLEDEIVRALAGWSRYTCAMDLDAARGFLREHARSVMATTRADARPQLSPVTHAVDNDGRVIVSSRETAYKVRNIRRRPQVSLCAFPDAFFGQWVQVDGPAEIVSLPDAMDLLLDYYRRLRGDHPDWDDYRRAMIREQRCLIRIAIDRAGPDHSG